MSIEVRIDPHPVNPLFDWCCAKLICNVCGEELEDHRCAMVMWLHTSPHVIYYAHKGQCLEHVESMSPDRNWMTDELQDHFYDILASLGFVQTDNEITLNRRT